MNKIALALILLILPFSLVYTSPRKKVGIVLSGGGAKGVAHIGVIKALEELNIPIDYIAGTSIGAIIGGLYSIGYTSEQLETIVKQTDWIDLLTDKVSRKEIPFPFWRPVVPFSVALLRCIPRPLARAKNSRCILAHSHLEIVLVVAHAGRTRKSCRGFALLGSLPFSQSP